MTLSEHGTTSAPSETTAPAVGPVDEGRPYVRMRLAQLALAYVSLATVLPQYVNVEVGPASIGLVVSAVFAAWGWTDMPSTSEMKGYLLWAFLLGSWALISALGAWNTTSAFQAMIYAGFVVFVVPGLASVMRRPRLRNALLLGWALGVGVYVVTSASRLARGLSVFDIQDGRTVSRLLDENRNAVNLVTLVILPFLLTGDGGRIFRVVRYPLAGLIGLWVFQSGGRAGILVLGVVAVVLALVQPGVSRAVQRFLVAGLVGVLVMTAIGEIGGQVYSSTDRLLGYIRGERTDADNARELLLRKAWHLTFEHPAFGVGFNRFEASYHPVIEEAETPRVREVAESFSEHNTYAATAAEMGFPGFAAFIATLVTLLVAGVRHVHDRMSRAATASVAGLLLAAFFQSANGPRLFLPFAVLLSTVIAIRAAPEPEESATGPLANQP